MIDPADQPEATLIEEMAEAITDATGTVPSGRLVAEHMAEAAARVMLERMRKRFAHHGHDVLDAIDVFEAELK